MSNSWKSTIISKLQSKSEVFMFSKSVNPVFLGASVVYGVADYVTSDY